MNRRNIKKYLTMVSRGGKNHVRRLPYREQWYRKYGLKKPVRISGSAQDEEVSLKEHDDQYHDGNYQQGQRCKLREALAVGDNPDSALSDTMSDRRYQTCPWMNPQKDAEYEEAFHEIEEAEKAGNFDKVRKLKKKAGELFMDHAAHAFSKSAVLDGDGFPEELYHGTDKGGFLDFDTEGTGKTRGTGAWFSNSRHNAKSYSRRDEDFSCPRITESYLRENDYLRDAFAIKNKNGEIDPDTIYNTEQEVRDAFDLDEGDSIVPIVALGCGWKDDEGFEKVEDAVKVANADREDYEDGSAQSCVYSVFVNMTDPIIRDAHEDSWDEITIEHVIRDAEDGEDVEWTETAEEAEQVVARLEKENPGKKYTFHPIKDSIDRIVAEERSSGCGYDGAIVRNCLDGGSNAYCMDITDDYIVFDSKNIKMSDLFTFDDNGELIPLSKRFDFRTADIRY